MSDVPIIGENTAGHEHDEDAATSDTAREVQHAFLVVHHLNGSWEAIADHSTPVSPILPCGVEEMASGAHAIENAIQASQIAGATVQFQMQMARQMQEQQQNTALLAGLNLK